MSLRDVLYPLNGIKVLIVSSPSTYKLINLYQIKNSTKLYNLYFEIWQLQVTFYQTCMCGRCRVRVHTTTHIHQVCVFVCLNLYSVSGSGGSEIMQRSYNWPSTGTLFRNQMCYNFRLKLNDPHYSEVTILQLLILLMFSHLQQPCGLSITPCGLSITLFSYY